MNALRLIFFFPLLASCQSKDQNNSNYIEPEYIVGKKHITDEIAGSAYRDSAISYFIVSHMDTSTFSPIFIRYKNNNQLSLNLNLPYFGDHLTYRQMLAELKIILESASKDFNFQYLSGITIGRLVLTGDLAVEITNDFLRKSANEKIKLDENEKVKLFLMESKLTSDFNELLAPYSLSIDDLDIEKVILTTRDELERLSNLESDISIIPDKILDCSIGLKLK